MLALDRKTNANQPVRDLTMTFIRRGGAAASEEAWARVSAPAGKHD
ncbi:hypothetical protein DB31_5292 [Hyalangium minutum]|uniref:Uncharacterized protein n=1 Tax=Hyalangium minutum TaxID=394096 RepID=A0A085WRD7_9BACT|nr:hypothetical protein DB31_5292 [Hyalangium minutum]